MNTYFNNNVNKESLSLLAAMALLIAAIATKLRPTVDEQVPEGYEDASGFHFGSPRLKD